MNYLNKKEVHLTKAEKELGTEAIPKLFRKFAIPGVIGLLFLGIQTIIDGIILGNYVGPNALASVSLILPCYSFMAAIAVMIGVGCQTLVSIRLGQQNRKGASDALTSAFIFLLGFSVAISILIYAFASEISNLLGANDVLQEGSINYIRSLVPFFPIISAMFFADYVLKALGQPIYSMLIMSGTVIINIVLDLVFIALFDMRTTGAGLATGLAFTAGALCSLPMVMFKWKNLSILSGRFRLNLVWQMFYNGSSEGISELSSGITVLLFNITLMQYLGESGVAAFTAIQYLFFIGITVFLGISDGIIPIISYNYGADYWERIKQVFMLALKINFIIGVCLFLLLFFFGEHVISLVFKSSEVDVIRIATQGAAIYAFAFFLNGMNILSSSYFTAMANAKISIIISLLRGLIFVAIGIYVFPKIVGINGIWLTVPVAEFCTAVISFFLVRQSLKKNSKPTYPVHL